MGEGRRRRRIALASGEWTWGPRCFAEERAQRLAIYISPENQPNLNSALGHRRTHQSEHRRSARATRRCTPTHITSPLTGSIRRSRRLGILLGLQALEIRVDGRQVLGEERAIQGTEPERLSQDAPATRGRPALPSGVQIGAPSGHLALGIGKSAGATMIMIPEEFPSDRKIPLSLVVDIITGSIIKRLAAGRNYGVAVTAEGLIEKIRIEDLEAADCVEYDDHGHIRYAEINFSDVLKKELLANLYSLGIRMTVNNKEVGYEVRCAPPCAYDIEYTRNLGYSAMEFLRNGGSNAMITIQNDRIVPIPFEDIMDPVTKKTQVRMVNTDSIQYRIAREYTIRLEKRDFEPGIELDKLAVAAKMTPEEFRKRFEYVTDY